MRWAMMSAARFGHVGCAGTARSARNQYTITTSPIERRHSWLFFLSSRGRHTCWNCDWSSDVCSSDLVLGPNGAGKTTAVKILTTLIRPDSGRAEVAGIDVLAHPGEVRRRIGVSGQYAAVDEYLRSEERRVGKERRSGRCANPE